MITGTIKTPVGEIKQVVPRLNRSDLIGAIKVRWLIGRNSYGVEPGLYAVGNPDNHSDVFASANYKLSFDHLRKNLDGLNAWILVLDTKGVNVWCAGGKGTFGTAELVNRIRLTRLDQLIDHRRIIVPQLGATGVSAYQVKALTTPSPQEFKNNSAENSVEFSSIDKDLKVNRGFHVIFGPVRASDIQQFIRNGYKATAEMRKVTFNFYDRLRLIPVDFIYARYKLLAAMAIIFVLSGITRHGFSIDQSVHNGFSDMIYIAMAYISGILLTPLILPIIPVRMFAFKGLITGSLLYLSLFLFNKLGHDSFVITAWFLHDNGL